VDNIKLGLKKYVIINKLWTGLMWCRTEIRVEFFWKEIRTSNFKNVLNILSN